MAFLASPGALYITGATIDVNGGSWMGLVLTPDRRLFVTAMWREQQTPMTSPQPSSGSTVEMTCVARCSTPRAQLTSHLAPTSA